MCSYDRHNVINVVVRSAYSKYGPAGLQSADNNALLIPQTSLKFVEWVFSVAGPAAWNSLPTDIWTTSSTPAVKKKLKTFSVLCDTKLFK